MALEFEKLREKILKIVEVERKPNGNHHIRDEKGITLFVLHDESLAHMLIGLRDVLRESGEDQTKQMHKFLSFYFPESAATE